MTTLQKVEEVTDPQIGETYLVRCGWPVPGSKLAMVGATFVPLLGPIHDDPELGFAEHHYHIDWRFVTRRTYEGIQQYIHRSPEFLMGMPAVAAVSEEGDRNVDCNLQLAESEYRPLVMERPHAVFPDWVVWLPKLEEKYKGAKLLKGGICPHRGISCAAVQESQWDAGVIICPGHGLGFDAKTGELQVRTKGLRPPR